MQQMKLKISKAAENAFEKIAKKVITLNETVIQNSFFFHRKTMFLKRQNSSLDAFNHFDSSFDRYQRQSINQKHQQEHF